MHKKSKREEPTCGHENVLNTIFQNANKLFMTLHLYDFLQLGDFRANPHVGIGYNQNVVEPSKCEVSRNKASHM